MTPVKYTSFGSVFSAFFLCFKKELRRWRVKERGSNNSSTTFLLLSSCLSAEKKKEIIKRWYNKKIWQLSRKKKVVGENSNKKKKKNLFDNQRHGPFGSATKLISRFRLLKKLMNAKTTIVVAW